MPMTWRSRSPNLGPEHLHSSQLQGLQMHLGFSQASEVVTGPPLWYLYWISSSKHQYEHKCHAETHDYVAEIFEPRSGQA